MGFCFGAFLGWLFGNNFLGFLCSLFRRLFRSFLGRLLRSRLLLGSLLWRLSLFGSCFFHSRLLFRFHLLWLFGQLVAALDHNEFLLADQRLEGLVDVHVGVVLDLVVALDVLLDGMPGRAGALFQGADSRSHHCGKGWVQGSGLLGFCSVSHLASFAIGRLRYRESPC